MYQPKNYNIDNDDFVKGKNTVEIQIDSDFIKDDARAALVDILSSINDVGGICDIDYSDNTFDGFDVDVDFWYSPPCRGYRERGGPPLEPDEDARIVDISVYINHKKDRIDITEYIDNLEMIEYEMLE